MNVSIYSSLKVLQIGEGNWHSLYDPQVGKLTVFMQQLKAHYEIVNLTTGSKCRVAASEI